MSILPKSFSPISVHPGYVIKDARGKEIKIGDCVSYLTAGEKRKYSSPEYGIITMVEHGVYNYPPSRPQQAVNTIYTYLKFDNSKIVREASKVLKLEQ